MLWLGRRARQLARVPALVQRLHNTNHEPRCHDQPHERCVAWYSLFSQTSTSPDITHAGTERKAHAHRAALSHPSHDEQLICAWIQQHLPQRPMESRHVYKMMVPQQSAVATEAAALVARVHEAARSGRGRANAAANALHTLLNEPGMVEYLCTDMQLAGRLLQALARCRPASEIVGSAHQVLLSLAAAVNTPAPSSVVLHNVAALVVLGVPLVRGSQLEAMLLDALRGASVDDMIQLLWYVVAVVVYQSYGT